MSKYNNKKVYAVEHEDLVYRFFKKEEVYNFCEENGIDKANIILFDSGKECDRWEELRISEQKDEISHLRRQVLFTLIPAQYADKLVTVRKKEVLKQYRAEAPVEYKADFTYIKDGKLVVEDVKSEMTRKLPDYIIKRKLMLWIHGIRLKEII